MITEQLLGIFNDPLFFYIHQDFLPTDCTDVIGKISCWCATDVVKVSRLNLQEKKEAKEQQNICSESRMHKHISAAIKDKSSMKMATVV